MVTDRTPTGTTEPQNPWGTCASATLPRAAGTSAPVGPTTSRVPSRWPGCAFGLRSRTSGAVVKAGSTQPGMISAGTDVGTTTELVVVTSVRIVETKPVTGVSCHRSPKPTHVTV